MLRSMNSAIAGLKNHQVFMDVIGNNIANVNTTAFKGSRVAFQTMLSQTIRGAVAPGEGRGGINAAQVGLGASVAGIDVLNTQGALSATGKVTDLAVQGDGYFVMSDGFRQYYTRDGAFDLSADGTLISPSTGLKVLGWGTTTDATGAVTVNNRVPPSGALTIPLGQLAGAKSSTAITFNGNLNGAATEIVGSGIVESTVAGTDTGIDPKIGFDIAGTDTITFTYNGTTYTTGGFAASYVQNTDPLTNVAADLEAAMNAAIDAVQGPGVGDIRVTVGDDTGTAVGEATFQFTGSKALKFGNSPSTNVGLNTALKNRSMTGLQSVLVPTRVFDSLGNKHDVTIRLDKLTTDPTTGPPPTAATDLWQWTVTNLDPGMTINAGTPPVQNGTGTGLLRMGTDGKFLSVNTTDGAATPAITNTSAAEVTFDYANGAASGQKVTFDFTQITQMQDANTVAAVVNDGHEAGSLLGFAIGQDGVITGSYSNGQNQILGQVALATFANAGGLTHVSQNLFVDSPNSGTALIGVAGTASRGTINAGQLEASNVDLAVQFTDMIRAERGFQANSRIITTSDEMLQDLVNLKR